MEPTRDGFESNTEFEKLLKQKQSETDALKRLIDTLRKLDKKRKKPPGQNDLLSG